MSKKKKKKKKEGVLVPIDRQLNQSYDGLVQDIQEMQTAIAMYERKEYKKQRKKLRKDPNYVLNRNKIKSDARMRVVKEFEDSDILDRVEDSFKTFGQTCIVLARCVAALIVCILSMEVVKTHISPAMLKRLEGIYNLAMAIR